ncbi:MAG: MBL fold metallo-hydrolase [Candidatus Hodarchaeales archaeon]|jgi:glyoxylase-like metal-dependent hydrolase (beta-lactamase superfamily II)
MDIDFDLELIGKYSAAITDQSEPIIFANAGATALRNFIVVIDPTYYPRTGRLLREKLEAYFNLPVKYLFLTHYHADHVFGANAFKDITIFTSIKALQNIIYRNNTGWQPSIEEMKQQEPEKTQLINEIKFIYPTLGFQDTLIVQDEDLKIEFHNSGGHTDCSSYAYIPHEKILFTGDLLFGQDFPGIFEETCNPDKWIQILSKFTQLDFNILVPGHGFIVDKNEVIKYLDFFNALKKSTQEVIQSGGTIDQVTLPEFYEPEEDYMWVKTTSVQVFYEFYSKNTK